MIGLEWDHVWKRMVPIPLPSWNRRVRWPKWRGVWQQSIRESKGETEERLPSCDWTTGLARDAGAEKRGGHMDRVAYLSCTFTYLRAHPG